MGRRRGGICDGAGFQAFCGSEAGLTFSLGANDRHRISDESSSPEKGLEAEPHASKERHFDGQSVCLVPVKLVKPRVVCSGGDGATALCVAGYSWTMMGTQGPGRKRLPNLEKLTAEDDALNQIAREVSFAPIQTINLIKKYFHDIDDDCCSYYNCHY